MFLDKFGAPICDFLRNLWHHENEVLDFLAKCATVDHFPRPRLLLFAHKANSSNSHGRWTRLFPREPVVLLKWPPGIYTNLDNCPSFSMPAAPVLAHPAQGLRNRRIGGRSPGCFPSNPGAETRSDFRNRRQKPCVFQAILGPRRGRISEIGLG